jgi:hypothetical protein
MYEDFLPTCNINQGTTYPILPVRCHCGKKFNQRKIESNIGKRLRDLEDSGLNQIDCYAKARSEAFSEMGYTRTCCLTSLTLYPYYPFNDVEGQDCIVDCTIHAEQDNIVNNYSSYKSKSVMFEFFPVKKDELGFDMDLYCRKLYTVVTGEVINKSVIKGSAETVYPKFPMLSGVRSDYPKVEIDPYNVPPIFN